MDLRSEIMLRMMGFMKSMRRELLKCALSEIVIILNCRTFLSIVDF
ncbi:hypothetical protein [Candidatus Acidianus copahuensis]|nr:hypothetical protein [Candidatus Acidianus copahuensis]